MIKGILNTEDALAAVASGAQGLVVSNHGGRQLDGVASAIAALPGIADAVAGRATFRREMEIGLALAGHTCAGQLRVTIAGASKIVPSDDAFEGGTEKNRSIPHMMAAASALRSSSTSQHHA